MDAASSANMPSSSMLAPMFAPMRSSYQQERPKCLVYVAVRLCLPIAFSAPGKSFIKKAPATRIMHEMMSPYYSEDDDGFAYDPFNPLRGIADEGSSFILTFRALAAGVACGALVSASKISPGPQIGLSIPANLFAVSKTLFSLSPTCTYQAVTRPIVSSSRALPC